MLTKFRISALITCIFLIEIGIYFWAAWFTEDQEFIFAKCARNSGRLSAALNLSILIMVAYYGLVKIYKSHVKKDIFRILITLFAINHSIHFFYIYQNFQITDKVLAISENLHGFITFIFILLIPVIVWTIKNLNKALYFTLILHIINTTYFAIDTFYSKVIHDPKPANLHRIGIVIMSILVLVIIYRGFRERFTDFNRLEENATN